VSTDKRTDRPRIDGKPTVRMSRIWLLSLAAIALVALAALLLPSGLALLLAALAFVAGTGLERFRQSHWPSPPAFGETPEAWYFVLRYRVGFAQLGVAAVLVALGLAVLLVSFGSGEGEPEQTAAAPPAAGPAPELRTRKEKPGRAFTAAGVSYRVMPAPGIETGAERGRSVGATVEIENRDREGFNPAEIDYRARRADDRLISPDVNSAVGSSTLTETGELPPGDSVEQQLVFTVPDNTRKLWLDFEPVPNGATTVSVALLPR
jgi:hypothetical protein